MKQVVFAVFLLAMASLTGCLNEEDSPVDENTDTTDDSTSDTTEDNTDTKDDELIDPVGGNGGYTPPETANISWEDVDSNKNYWVAKDGHRITTSCFNTYENSGNSIVIYDSDDRIIYLANGGNDYGAKAWGDCSSGEITIDVTLGPEPVKVGLTKGTVYTNNQNLPMTNHFSWIVTF